MACCTSSNSHTVAAVRLHQHPASGGWGSGGDTTHTLQTVTGSSGSTVGDDMQMQAAPLNTPSISYGVSGMQFVSTGTPGAFVYPFGTFRLILARGVSSIPLQDP